MKPFVFLLTLEGLRHSPSEMIIGLTKSPEGKPCIGMTFSDKEWVLYRTMPALTADQLRKQLQEMGVESLPGAPFNWRASLEEKRLIMFEDTPEANKPVGVFIPADRFDSIDATIVSYVRNRRPS
jgi:hypothetical protein